MINHAEPQKYESGSIYLFQAANRNVIQRDGWNLLEVESRKGGMRVKLNGQEVAAHPGDPARPTRGPIGLQLHDQNTVIEFRRIEITPR